MTNPTSALLVKPIHLVPSAARLTSPLAQHLRKSLRGDVLFDAASRGRYATDASIYQIMPVGVVVPRDQDDLRIALEIARSEKVPLLARGAGTSQCGQTVGEALVIDTSKWLNNIVAFDAEARTVTVEPGVVLDHLNAWLKPHGLWFPVDVSTAAQCTIGGMAGNNSCGSRSIEYGNMVHNVEAIDAILADGSEARFALAARGAARRALAADSRRRDADRATRARRNRRACAEGLAPRGGLQHRPVRLPEPARLYRRRHRESRASAGRLGRHARVQPAVDAEARAAARA